MTITAIKSAETRDLDADLEICEAATAGPYHVNPCACGDDSCKQVIINLTRSMVRLHLEDAEFIAEARQGWPYAIRRAQEAERENDRLRNEIDMLQEQLNQHHRSDCYD